MSIKTECFNCGETSNIFYDVKRHGVWCNSCGELDQLPIKEYDFEEVEE